MPRLKTLLVEILDDFGRHSCQYAKAIRKTFGYYSSIIDGDVTTPAETTPAVTMLFIPIHE